MAWGMGLELTRGFNHPKSKSNKGPRWQRASEVAFFVEEFSWYFNMRCDGALAFGELGGGLAAIGCWMHGTRIFGLRLVGAQESGQLFQLLRGCIALVDEEGFRAANSISHLPGLLLRSNQVWNTRSAHGHLSQQSLSRKTLLGRLVWTSFFSSCQRHAGAVSGLGGAPCKALQQ